MAFYDNWFKPNTPKEVQNKTQREYSPRINPKDGASDYSSFYRASYSTYAYSDLAKNTTIVRAIINKNLIDTFRQGIIVYSDYKAKCIACGRVHKTSVEVCDCGSTKFITPSVSNKTRLEKLITRANVNEDSLLDVLRQFEKDRYEQDLGIIQLIYMYTQFQDGKKNYIVRDLKEVQRVNPRSLQPIIGQKGVLGVNNQGVSNGFCPIHREQGIYDLRKRRLCPTCNTPLYTADYKSVNPTDLSENKVVEYYNRSEIIYRTKYNLTSPYSPIETLGDIITSLRGMERLTRDTFVDKKNPRRIVIFKSNDSDSIERAADRNQQKLKEDPTYIPVYVVGSDVQGDPATTLDILDNMEQLQFIELMDRYERLVANMYRVVIDPATREIKPDPYAIQDAQNDINTHVMSRILSAMNIDDWCMKLRPSEMADEANELRLEGLKIQNAMGRINLGFDIKDFDEDTKEYIFSDKPTRNPEQTNFSSFSSNSRGLEDVFGPTEGTEDLNKK